MSAIRSARLFLDSIPDWRRRDAAISELSGGINNHSFLVESGGRRYVLRVTNDHDLSGVRDHELELKIQQLAARQGLAPEVLFADPASGLMLSVYLPGRSMTARDFRSRDNLAKLADTLRQLHRLPKSGVRLDPLAAAERYMQPITESGEAMPFAEHCLNIIRSAPPPESLCCCHNDIVAENVIDGERLRLIDFEYARDNDPLFDIASVVGWHNLPEGDADYLLDAYIGGRSREWTERMHEQQRQFDALQWLWMAARQVIRPLRSQERQMQRAESRLR